MRKPYRILIYILINIFISAVTVLVVLWIWGKAQPNAQIEQEKAFVPVTENPASSMNEGNSANLEENPGATLDFIHDEIQLSIHAIVGKGDLDVEYVEIHNESQGPIDMSGWQLTDQDGNVFVFPALILNEGGAIKILSKMGNNTVIELYWQSDVPIWQSGETARLLNADGETIATYSIP